MLLFPSSGPTTMVCPSGDQANRREPPTGTGHSIRTSNDVTSRICKVVSAARSPAIRSPLGEYLMNLPSDSLGSFSASHDDVFHAIADSRPLATRIGSLGDQARLVIPFS